MPKIDFTLTAYQSLLEALLAGGYATSTIERYLRGERPTDGPLALLRHDVDRLPQRALAMARLERQLGVQSTYYFRAAASIFKPEIVRQVAGLGHEIGYHYETLSKANGDYPAAWALFEKELSRFRQVCPVTTASMHGSPLSPFDNRDLWQKYDFREAGLLGEAYLSIDYTSIKYLTDAGRSWAPNPYNLRDAVPASAASFHADPQPPHSTFELMGAVKAHRYPRLCISAHPERWAGNFGEWMLSFSLDFAANQIKRILRRLRG